MIELGVPFSDPIADGPAIQEANTVSTGRDQVEERGNGKRRLISRSSSFFFCLLVLQSTVPNCYSAWIAPRPASPDLDPNVNLPQPSTTNAPPPQPTAANPPGRPPKQRDLRRLPRFVKDARKRGLRAPVLLMGYYNPLLSHGEGEEQAVRDAKIAGANGFIVVDLPPEEAIRFRGVCTGEG